MIINRAWEMANKNTFRIKAIRKVIEKYAFGKIVDPFANENRIANIKIHKKLRRKSCSVQNAEKK